tara:strand:+ start:1245 stop:1412 length:168 start_codon:yes stop_codon:yes gene_type:complete
VKTILLVNFTSIENAYQLLAGLCGCYMKTLLVEQKKKITKQADFIRTHPWHLGLE